MTSRAAREIEDEAIRWVVRMHSDQVTHDDEVAFTAWLGGDRAHGAAYDQQAALWAGVAALREDAAALAALKPLRRASPMSPMRSTGALIGRRGLLAASAAAVAGIAGAVALRPLLAEDAYVTGVGEQRRVVLADGSAVTLNTNSALRVRFDDGQRRVWVDRGQAFFDVASDASRPFRVYIGTNEVRAVGTAFDVYRGRWRTRVTLEEGAVAVFRDANQAEQLRAEERPVVVLAPNEQVVLTSSGSFFVNDVDTRRTGAWRHGQMVLESEVLSYAVFEINRYNARQIVIADPTLEQLRVSGVFETGMPEIFVEALMQGFPVGVRFEDDKSIMLVRRADGPPR